MARAPLAGTARTAGPALGILVSRPLSPLPPQCCLSLFVASARSSSASLSGSSAASTASTWPDCCSSLTATDPSYRRPSDYLCADLCFVCHTHRKQALGPGTQVSAMAWISCIGLWFFGFTIIMWIPFVIDS
jgi:hypothetical protein